MLLCKKIKIEVNQQDAEALEFMQAKCRGLYNWWVMKPAPRGTLEPQHGQEVPAREQAV